MGQALRVSLLRHRSLFPHRLSAPPSPGMAAGTGRRARQIERRRDRGGHRLRTWCFHAADGRSEEHTSELQSRPHLDLHFSLHDALPISFQTGEGVGWDKRSECLFCGTARFFRTGYRHHLVQEWLPALEGVLDKLKEGATVADIGCGHGVSTLLMADRKSTRLNSSHVRISISTFPYTTLFRSPSKLVRGLDGTSAPSVSSAAPLAFSAPAIGTT